MATIHYSPSSATKRTHYQQRDERTSYLAMWAILAFITAAALGYGYYFTEKENIEGTPLIGTPVVTPAADGSASSMSGAGTMLTPSDVTPGSPDTTTTESTNVPADGIR